MPSTLSLACPAPCPCRARCQHAEHDCQVAFATVQHIALSQPAPSRASSHFSSVHSPVMWRVGSFNEKSVNISDIDRHRPDKHMTTGEEESLKLNQDERNKFKYLVGTGAMQSLELHLSISYFLHPLSKLLICTVEAI